MNWPAGRMATAAPPEAQEMRQTLKQIQNNLQCPICLEVLSEPHNTLCGHSYCKGCICTAISSSKRPKCPLCKEPITKRSLRKNDMLSELVEAVGELEKAIISDTGITSTPPKVVPHHSGVAGTPGVRLHSILHLTPVKPRPLDDGGESSECDESGSSEEGEGEGGGEIENRPSTSASKTPPALTCRKRKLFKSPEEGNSPDNLQKNDSANAALIEALNKATLRLPDNYPDNCDTLRPNLRHKGKEYQDNKQPLKNVLSPPVPQTTPNRGRGVKRFRGAEGEYVGREPALSNGGSVHHSAWLVSSDSDEDYDETVPVSKVAASLLPDDKPLSSPPASQRCPEGRAESSKGPENEPPIFATAPCSALHKNISTTTGERTGNKAKQRHRALKQAPLELFCK